MKCSFPKQHLTSVTVWRPKSTRVSLAGLLSATSISSTGVSILHSGQIRKHHVEEKPPIRDFWPEFRQVQTLEMVVIYEKFGPCNADGQQSSKCISIQKGPLVIICQGDWWADKSQLNIPFFQTNFHQKKEVNNTSIHPTTLRPIDPLLNFSQASVPLLHLPGPLPELLPHVVDRDQMESTCVESGFVILLGHLSPELVWPVPLARLAVLLTIRGVKMAKGQLCNVYKEHM